MRNLLSTLALAATFGLLPAAAGAQNSPPSPVPPQQGDALKQIDQRLDRLERTVRALASRLGRLYRVNMAREGRMRRLEAALRNLRGPKARPSAPPAKKVATQQPPAGKGPSGKPAPKAGPPRVRVFGGRLSPEIRKKIHARLEALRKSLKKMPPEKRKRVEAFLKKMKDRFHGKPQDRKDQGKPKAGEKQEKQEKHGKHEKYAKHGKRGKAGSRRALTPIRIRRDARKGKSGSKAQSKPRIRVETFSPDRFREFARRYPMAARIVQRLQAARKGAARRPSSRFRSRPRRSGAARPPMKPRRRHRFHRRPMGRKMGPMGRGFAPRRAFPMCPRRRHAMGRRGPRAGKGRPSFGRTQGRRFPIRPSDKRRAAIRAFILKKIAEWKKARALHGAKGRSKAAQPRRPGKKAGKGRKKHSGCKRGTLI